jgi:polyprenyl-phospho-N-acetylgalactosaminyl synthase
MRVLGGNSMIAVIIPAYNEALKIFHIVRQVKSCGCDVVVVDDGSSDKTSQEATRAGAIVLPHFINRGYGAALETGNQWALRRNYDIIVHFDGDGQHNANEIKRMIAPIEKGEADVVIGSRFLSNHETLPIIRKILIKFAVLFTWIFSSIKLTDAHNGFRAFSGRALKVIQCKQDGMSYASEVIDQIAEHNLKIVEVPVTIQYTDYSKSKGESNIKKVLLGLRFLWGKVIK